MSELTILLGCERIPLTFLDHHEEDVPVYHLGARQLPLFLALEDRGLEAEPEIVELYARQAKGWADTLTQSAYEQVLAKGEAMNRPFCERGRAREAASLAARATRGMEQMRLAQSLGIPSGVPSPVSAPTTA